MHVIKLQRFFKESRMRKSKKSQNLFNTCSLFFCVKYWSIALRYQ